MDDIPHIALPIQFLGGRYATVQQDTTAEVAACVAAIVSSEVEAAIANYEPRADVTVTEGAYDPSDPLAVEVEIVVNVIQAED
jgi:predicted component of type VI protein secretion system